jgi:hypothetical protein
MIVVVVVRVGGSVVVEVVDVTVTVVVVVSQRQLRRPGVPTATFRQVSASVAFGLPPDALRSQMQVGSQTLEPTAARKMKRQSVAVGFGPLVAG